MDRAAIRRTDYPAMRGNQLVTESQAHFTSGYRQALTDNGCWAKEEEELINKKPSIRAESILIKMYSNHVADLQKTEFNW